jgi:hypothetical protein
MRQVKFNNEKIYDTNPKYCLFCEKKIDYDHKQNIYCNAICMGNHLSKIRTEKRINSFLTGDMDDDNARRYFRKLNDKKCSICGLTEWNGKEIPLVVDHIDGDYRNNIPNNLRFICCNCDAQLDTYKGKNKGHGRNNRK